MVTPACFEEPALQAEKEPFSYDKHLLDLVIREHEGQRWKWIQNWMRASGLPVEKSVEPFDLKRIPPKVSQQVRTLLEGTFLDRKENLRLFGNSSSGKSHLLCAIAQELWAARDRKVKYATCTMLVRVDSQLFVTDAPPLPPESVTR